MKRQISWLIILSVVGVPLIASALSRSIGRDIEFRRATTRKRAEAIRKVIRNENYEFVDGIVSYWPPDWGTRLSFKGDAAKLNSFISELRELKGIGMRLVLYRGRDDESRRDSAWQLDYSHARPNQVTIYLNLNAPELDFYKIKFPEWPSN
jgi:hypothetical protein